MTRRNIDKGDIVQDKKDERKLDIVQDKKDERKLDIVQDHLAALPHTHGERCPAHTTRR